MENINLIVDELKSAGFGTFVYDKESIVSVYLKNRKVYKSEVEALSQLSEITSCHQVGNRVVVKVL